MSVIGDVWDLVEQIVNQEQVGLFDIDLPGRHKGTLRVYLRGLTKVSEVELSHCERVTRRLRDSLELEERLPGDFLIEVSSPGINRRLRRPEHYSGAIGERVEIAFRELPTLDQIQGRERLVVGALSAFDGSNLTVEDEKTKEAVVVPLDRLRKAQVSFKF